MRAGHRVVDLPPLAHARDYCREQLSILPSALRLLGNLDEAEPIYSVRVSSGVRALAHSIDAFED